MALNALRKLTLFTILFLPLACNLHFWLVAIEYYLASLPDPLNFVYRNLHLGQAKLIVSFSSLSVLILSGLLYAAVDGRGFGKN